VTRDTLEVAMHDLDRTLLEVSPAEAGYGFEAGGPLSEAEEMELAGRLLEAQSAGELEQFLGDVVGTVGRALGHVLPPATGQAVTGLLSSALGPALPAQLADQAGQLLGLELEGLSPEDREFDTSRQLVRLAAAATEHASAAPAGAEPAGVAHQAVTTAVQQYAPGLLRQLPGRSGHPWPRSGRWVRHGQTITLYG
jgi:hypothetical protein